MMPWYGGMPFWGAAFMTLSALVLFAVLAGGAFVIVRLLDGGTGQPAIEPTPGQILARRLAEGEISEQEYQAKLALLEQNHAVRGS